MKKELIKQEKVLDKIYTIVGDEGTDIILNSKGNVKVRFGNSFLNLIKNGKITSEAISDLSSSSIKEVNDISEIISDGIYYSKLDKGFYISFNGITFELNTRESEEDDDPSEGGIDYTTEKYLLINKKQKLTSDQLKYALENLKLLISSVSDDIKDIPNSYPVYITSKERHYKKVNGKLEEIYLNLNDGGTVKGTVNIGETSSNYPKSKLNVISSSPITLFDGNSSSLKIIFKEDNIILIPNNSTYTKYVINTKGIGIGTTPTVPLEVLGNEIVRGILRVINGRIVTEDIGSNVFFPGFTGEGFRIYRDSEGRYSAEFDNLTVRQTMRIYELILEKIRVVKGSLIISQGGSIVKNVTEMIIDADELDDNYLPTGNKITVDCYKITFEEEYLPFTKNDLVRCQVFQYPNVRGYWVWVRSVDGDSIYVDKSEFEVNEEPKIGDEICQLGNVIDPNRQSAIYLSASDTVNPIIDILSDIKQKSFSGSIRCRLGNLSGITYGNNELEGHGLFGDNVYLKGKLVTFGHDPNNSIDIGDFYESNSINLSKAHELKLFFTDNLNQLIFYNGDYTPDEKRIIKNPEYITPIMKDGEYEFNPSDPLNPTESDIPMYIELTLNPPSDAPLNSIYNYTKDKITTCYQKKSTGWEIINEFKIPGLDIDLLTIEIDLCKQLNLLGSNSTLYYSEYGTFPIVPYNTNDYWITTDNKIYISLADRKSTDSSILDDWAERNLAQSSIREDVALKLGYDNYKDLMDWALKGNTIIEGGYINTRLLEAEIIIGNKLIEGPYMRSDKIEIRDPNNINITRWRFTADSITGGIETIGSNEISHVKFLPDGTMYGLKNNDSDLNPWRFNSDGSGSFALGNISWDTDGVITFSQGVLDKYGGDYTATVINGGLVTTGTIALGGNGEGDDVFVARAGMTGGFNYNGSLLSDNDVRIWAGGTLEEATHTVDNDIFGSGYTDTASFVVTHGGKLFASDAVISGTVNIGTGSTIGDLHLTVNGFEIYNNEYFPDNPDERFGVGFGNIKTKDINGDITNELFGIMMGIKNLPNDRWYNPSIIIGQVLDFDNYVTILGDTQIMGQAWLYSINAFKLKYVKSDTIQVTHGTNEKDAFVIDTEGKSYIELVSTNNQTFTIALSEGEIGQKLVLYNANPHKTHRLELVLFQGWYWLIEQSAAEFIYTTHGWRLLKGVFHDY